MKARHHGRQTLRSPRLPNDRMIRAHYFVLESNDLYTTLCKLTNKVTVRLVRGRAFMEWLFRQRRSRRPPPSDAEIRLRCLEASIRSVSNDRDHPHQIAENAIRIADVFCAYVKGNTMRSVLIPELRTLASEERSVIAQQSLPPV